MLTRCFSALVGMLVLLTIAAPSAFADGVSCPNGQQYNAFTMTCFIAVSVPGSQGAAQAAPVAVVDQGGRSRLAWIPRSAAMRRCRVSRSLAGGRLT